MAAGARGEFHMELDQDEMDQVKYKCEQDNPNQDVTEAKWNHTRTLLEHALIEYSWNSCSGQLLLNARRVP